MLPVLALLRHVLPYALPAVIGIAIGASGASWWYGVRLERAQQETLAAETALDQARALQRQAELEIEARSRVEAERLQEYMHKLSTDNAARLSTYARSAAKEQTCTISQAGFDALTDLSRD